MENESKKDGLHRANVRVTSTVKNYFDKKKKETGISKSAMMSIALEEYVARNSKNKN